MLQVRHSPDQHKLDCLCEFWQRGWILFNLNINLRQMALAVYFIFSPLNILLFFCWLKVPWVFLGKGKRYEHSVLIIKAPIHYLGGYTYIFGFDCQARTFNNQFIVCCIGLVWKSPHFKTFWPYEAARIFSSWKASGSKCLYILHGNVSLKNMYFFNLKDKLPPLIDTP